ncbi:GNAT family N-acetyltransferase [Celerinatantimonas diazotrophica]|uniref:Ribosomal protein S18 acetylase RimI-like enzyme n=1 Tax=Celerinatantimonas diazotrophica TaxID=412034 RepID=A0A4R1J8G7_9GAMM|nr:GNAT family N-acetyltransferase [Celerinatantimonas diazotrophica]TCK46657.1 ribosomal protein S18 acetylase RimI-like enzyme [Celerinatantimonas diazotrophica]CAG9295359.1 hypothetical protein CEDIAZO_00475 [Celerinatantimonas diazotrophica]
MTFSYRRLKSDDALSYRHIRLESLKLYPEYYGSNYDDELNQPELFFESQIKSASPENIMIGAYRDNILIGLCGLITTEGNQFLIVQMYVRAEFQGNGVGQGLLSEAKSQLIQHKRSSLVLTVYEENKSALDAYSRAGFTAISRDGKEITMSYQP